MFKDIVLWSYKYNLRKLFNNRDVKIDYVVLLSIGFLCICSPLLLIVFQYNIKNSYQAIFNFFISFIIVGYDKPIINCIYSREEYNNFKLNNFIAIKFCVINTIIRNPIIMLLIIYSIENIIFNFGYISLIQIIWLFLLLFLVYLKNELIKIIILFYCISNLYLNFIFEGNNLYYLIIFLLGLLLCTILSFIFHRCLLKCQYTTQLVNLINFKNKVIFPLKPFFLASIKEFIVKISLIFLYIIAVYRVNTQFSIIPIFLLIFDCELLLDYRYNYFNKYISKYYLIYYSKLNSVQRFYYSEYFFIGCKYLFMLIFIIPIIAINKFIILFILICGLAYIYFVLENIMMKKQQRSNNFLCQYLIFIVVMTILFFI